MPLALRRLTFALLCSLLLHASPAFSATHGLSMWGEPKYAKDFTHFDYVNPAAPKGGMLKQAAIGTYDSFNPHILQGVGAAGLGLTTQTLLSSSKDEPFSAYGQVAETVAIAPDKKSVTFTLRKKARFHDGTPITADDITYSFMLFTTKAHPFYKSYYAEIEKVEAVDTHTVTFHFKTDTNRELPLIVGQIPVLSKAYWEAHDFTKPTLEPPLGSGPYKIAAFEPGKWIRYERVKNYWAADLPVNKGQFNFDTVQFDYYRDATVAIEAFKAGEYGIRQENISKMWASAYNSPALKKGWFKKEKIAHEIPTGMQGFVFNTRRAPFNNLKFRQALTFALDFEWTNKNLFHNAYTRTRSYFSNSEFASRGLPEGKELALLEPFRDKLPKALFKHPYHPPRTDGSGNNRKQLLRARDILKHNGFTIKEGVLVGKDGNPIELEFLLVSPSFERVTAPIIKNLAKLGIKARMRTVDPSQYIKRLETFDFDITVNVFGQSNSPGNEQHNFWHSSKASVEGSENLAGINHPVVDALVKNITTAKTKEELVATTRALDRVLLWQYYVIPQWHFPFFRVAYWDKFGKPATPPKYDFGLMNWWIDPQKSSKIQQNSQKTGE